MPRPSDTEYDFEAAWQRDERVTAAAQARNDAHRGEPRPGADGLAECNAAVMRAFAEEAERLGEPALAGFWRGLIAATRAASKSGSAPA